MFDVGGCHPNIQRVGRTPWLSYDYAIKDGDVVCGGAERPTPTATTSRATDDRWATITSAESVDEFWELVHELDPKSAACSFNSLARYADWRFGFKPAEYVHPTGVDFTDGDLDGRSAWLEQAALGSPTNGESPQMNTWGCPLRPAGLRDPPISWFITGVV